jgi:hypothetical protein
MAFQEGTANSMFDFLDKFVTFCGASIAGLSDFGTINVNATFHSVSSMPARVLTNGSIYWVMYVGNKYSGSSDDTIYGRMIYTEPTNGMVFDNDTPSDGQDGFTIIGKGRSPDSLTANYYFFAEDESAAAVLEFYDDTFTHMSLGTATKYASNEGGEFITGNNLTVNSPPYPTLSDGWAYIFKDGTRDSSSVSGGFVRNDQNAIASSDFASLSQGSANGVVYFDYKQRLTGSSGDDGYYNHVFHNGYSSATQRRALLPVIFNFLSPGDGVWRQIGNVPCARLCRTDGLAPKQIIDGNWQVFPLAGYDSNLCHDTGLIGLAYKRA